MKSATPNRPSVLGIFLALGLVFSPALSGPAAAQESDDDDNSELEEVVVTGSRIARDRFDAPTPTISIDAQAIETQGMTNAIELVNQLPQVLRGYANANTHGGFSRAGLNQPNLRNLGVNRTLTLVDGRRRVGTPDDNNFLAFDYNNIPTALIDRVEVQTGGTSAVYGADAVAGVINIIRKKDFSGLDIFATGSGTEDGHYTTSSFGATIGANTDTSNVVFHASYTETGKLTRADIGQDSQFLLVSNPDDTGPNDGIPALIPVDNLRRFTAWGPTMTANLPLGANGAVIPVIFDNALGDFRPFDAGPRGVIDGQWSTGADGGLQPDYAIVPVDRLNLFGMGRIEVAPNIDFVAEAMYARSEAESFITATLEFLNTTMSIDNPFMPDATRNALIAAGQDGFTFFRSNDEFGLRGAPTDRSHYSVAAGFEGSFGDTWEWSFVAEYGETATQFTLQNSRIDPRWFESIDVISDPVTGEPVCRSEEARADGCVPVNLFGEGTITQAGVDYSRVDHTSHTDSSQTLVQAIVGGELFELPADPVQVVAGFEYRDESLQARPSYVFTSGIGFFGTRRFPVDAEAEVNEFFAEFLVPVLKDVPLVTELNVEAAYRYSDYKVAGSTDSWKLGLQYRPVEDLNFRMTRARAVRAPSMGEIADGGAEGAFLLDDPCDPVFLSSGTAARAGNCAALGLDPVTFDPVTRTRDTLVFTTGNPLLQPETADTWTAGFVFTPRFAQGLAVSVDFYNIELEEIIQRSGPQATLNNCVDLPSLDNQFCSLVRRGADGNISRVLDSFVNISRLETSGVDVDVSYTTELADLVSSWPGALTVRFLANFLDDYTTFNVNAVTGESTPTEFHGDFNNPEFRFDAGVTYSLDRLSVTWSPRFVGETVINKTTANPAENAGDWFDVPSVWYHNLSTTYEFDNNIRVIGGITNLLDEGPRYHPNTRPGRSPLDTLFGRQFFLTLQANFGQ